LPPLPFPLDGVLVGVPPEGDADGLGELVGDPLVLLGDAVGVTFCGCTKIWTCVPFGSTWFCGGFWL
jgi:hypothetical protein